MSSFPLFLPGYRVNLESLTTIKALLTWTIFQAISRYIFSRYPGTTTFGTRHFVLFFVNRLAFPCVPFLSCFFDGTIRLYRSIAAKTGKRPIWFSPYYRILCHNIGTAAFTRLKLFHRLLPFFPALNLSNIFLIPVFIISAPFVCWKRYSLDSIKSIILFINAFGLFIGTFYFISACLA